MTDILICQGAFLLRSSLYDGLCLFIGARTFMSKQANIIVLLCRQMTVVFPLATARLKEYVT
jgi:hypothetical protein